MQAAVRYLVVGMEVLRQVRGPFYGTSNLMHTTWIEVIFKSCMNLAIGVNMCWREVHPHPTVQGTMRPRAHV